MLLFSRGNLSKFTLVNVQTSAKENSLSLIKEQREREKRMEKSKGLTSKTSSVAVIRERAKYAEREYPEKV